MSIEGEPTFFKKCVGRIIAAFPSIDRSQREFILAGIQVTVGAGLAAYTFKDPTYKIFPYVFSATAIGGTYSVLKVMQKNSETTISFLRRPRAWSSWDFASGMFAFTTGVYAFSESVAINDKMWIPCLPLAASGFYFAATSVSTLDPVVNRRPFLKCCQLMFEPALVTCASTYLFHFRGHNQGWLKVLPFIVIGNTGFNIAGRGCIRDGTIGGPRHLQLKVIEMFMGSCYLTISGMALAIYSASYGFFWPWTPLMSFVSLIGMFTTYGSLACLQRYLEVDCRVFYSTVGIFLGLLTFSSAYLVKEFVEESDAMYVGFFVLAGTSQLILYTSLHQFYTCINRQTVHRYCQRIFGPVLAVYSSVVSGYTAYSMGWKFSLLTMPFIPFGMYATYIGFREEEEVSSS